MQALSNLTWIPSLVQNQGSHHHHQLHRPPHHPPYHHTKMASSKPRPHVVTDFALFKNLKRKRADSGASPENGAPQETASPPEPKRQKSDAAAAAAAPTPIAPVQLASAQQQSPSGSISLASPATPQQGQDFTPQPTQVSTLGSHHSKAAPSPAATAPTPAPSSQVCSTFPSQQTKVPSAVDVSDQPSHTPPDAPKDKPSSVLGIPMPLKLKDTPEAKAKARQVIESQLNLEILLKHQELRLIDQELAKCQVSLEQIRRCQIIPYPGQDGSQATHEQISTGSGPAVEPARGLARPQHPAPWGVTDGPYTRHYAKWLISDSTFDAGFPVTRGSTAGRGLAGTGLRSTRGSYFDFGPASSSRYQRASAGSKFHALSNNYTAPPKERHGPLIIKRPSDGQYVKLVCKFCQKDNISSVQGFLNHCRIAHQKSYESHGEAAEECGVVMDTNETNAALTTPTTEQNCHSQSQPQSQKQPQQQQQQHPPQQQQMLLQQPMLPLSTPTSAVATPSHGKPFVHPLITQPTTQQPRIVTLSKPKAKPRSPSGSVRPQAGVVKDGKAVPRSISPTDKVESLIPCLQTPKLSALLQKRGIVGNLSRLVTSSQEKCDIDAIQYIGQDESDAVHDETGVASTDVDSLHPGTAPPLGSANGSQGQQHQPATGRASSRGGPASQLNIRGGMTGSLGTSNTNAAATSSKGQASLAAAAAARFLPSTPFDQEGSIVASDMGYSREFGLSPHTMDTNPGLTEDEAYEPGEDSDHEQSTTDDHASPATDSLDMDLDVEVRDFGDGPSSNRRNGMRRHSRGHEEHLDDSQEVKAPLPAAPARLPSTQATSADATALPSAIPAKRKRGRPAKDRKGSVGSTADNSASGV